MIFAAGAPWRSAAAAEVDDAATGMVVRAPPLGGGGGSSQCRDRLCSNGGPLDHTYNWPLRGGKHTQWEGGIRGEAFVWSKSDALLPSSARGTTWRGLAHSSDWVPTVIEGVFGLDMGDDQDYGTAGKGGGEGEGEGDVVKLR